MGGGGVDIEGGGDVVIWVGCWPEMEVVKAPWSTRDEIT